MNDVSCLCKWEVCDVCKGRGASSAYLGAFTSDMIDELGQDWLDDYRAGNMDRPCENCKGRTTVKVHVETCEFYEEFDYAGESERRFFAMVEDRGY